MKTISIKQPWAWLVAMGIKNIENRTWKCPKKYIGERILIHASGKWDDNHREMSRLFTTDQWKSLSDKNQSLMVGGILPTSSIIGSVQIIDCVIKHNSIWAQQWITKSWHNGVRGGKYDVQLYNWVLANPIIFPEQIPAKGKLSLWDYPNIVAEPEEKDGPLFCHCQLPVKEENQVMPYGDGTFRCRYCGGQWYK